MSTQDYDQPPEPQSYQPEFAKQEPELGLLETCVSVITEPVDTLRRVVQKRPIGWAFIVLISIAAASWLIEAVSFNPSDFGSDSDLSSTARGFAIVAAVIGGPIVSLTISAFVTGCIWVMSRILGGKGPYSGLFVGFAFAGVPTAILIPVGILTLPLGAFGDILSVLVVLAVSIWALVLSAIVIRENNGFTTARAVVALLVPIAIMAAIMVMFVILFVILIAVASIAVTETSSF